MWIKNSFFTKKGLRKYQEFHDLPQWHSRQLEDKKKMIDADTMQEGINKVPVIIYMFNID